MSLRDEFLSKVRDKSISVYTTLLYKMICNFLRHT